MNNPNYNFSKELKELIVNIQQDAKLLNNSIKIEKLENSDELIQALRDHKIIVNWDKQQIQDRGFRTVFAWILLITLILQIIAVNVIIFGIGFKWLVFDKWVIDIFIVSVFGEVAGMALIIVNYLFPQTQDTTTLMKDIHK